MVFSWVFKRAPSCGEYAAGPQRSSSGDDRLTQSLKSQTSGLSTQSWMNFTRVDLRRRESWELIIIQSQRFKYCTGFWLTYFVPALTATIKAWHWLKVAELEIQVVLSGLRCSLRSTGSLRGHFWYAAAFVNLKSLAFHLHWKNLRSTCSKKWTKCICSH